MRTYCMLLRDDRFQRLSLLTCCAVSSRLQVEMAYRTSTCNAANSSRRWPCDQLAQRGSLSRKYFPSVFWNTNGFLPHNYAYLLVHISSSISHGIIMKPPCPVEQMASHPQVPQSSFILLASRKQNKEKAVGKPGPFHCFRSHSLARYNRTPCFDNLQQ